MIQDYFGVSLSAIWKLALPLTDVETVIKLEQTEIATVPGIAQFWYGVTNYRGNLLWVLDPENFLQLDSSQINSTEKLTAVVLTCQLQGTTKRIAFVVKQLAGVVSIRTELLTFLSNDDKSQFFDLFIGQIIVNDNLFYLLDVEKLFREISKKSNLVIA